jgi:hypothetical protein
MAHFWYSPVRHCFANYFNLTFNGITIVCDKYSLDATISDGNSWAEDKKGIASKKIAKICRPVFANFMSVMF